MKLAIISDIHGNYQALEAVIRDISEQGVDKIVCLGDLATIGPQPTAVINKMNELNIISIMGNHDQAVLDPDKAQEYQIAPPLISSLHWCRDRMNESDIEYIRGSKPFLQIEINSDNNLLLFHGSPLSTTDILLSETPKSALDKYFKGFSSNILIGGHTHYQLVRFYKERVLINSGSVGASFRGEVLPNSNPSINPWAEYAIIEISGNGLSINLLRVNYDVESYLTILQGSDLPVKDWWISELSSPGN